MLRGCVHVKVVQELLPHGWRKLLKKFGVPLVRILNHLNRLAQLKAFIFRFGLKAQIGTARLNQQNRRPLTSREAGSRSKFPLQSLSSGNTSGQRRRREGRSSEEG